VLYQKVEIRSWRGRRRDCIMSNAIGFQCYFHSQVWFGRLLCGKSKWRQCLSLVWLLSRIDARGKYISTRVRKQISPTNGEASWHNSMQKKHCRGFL
jgi:hypothetical protein